ncbi:MAG: ORF6N domain-containing protein [Planctomycetota bacterium]|jgi:phage regulator Rha-like protein
MKQKDHKTKDEKVLSTKDAKLRVTKTGSDSKSVKAVLIDRIQNKIVVLRGQRAILDSDMATLYGIETGALVRAVKRNIERFPYDFMFQLTKEEYDSFLRCQNGISKKGRGGRRYLPYAFTEHGAVMAANVIRSERAIQISVYVVRAFVELRKNAPAYRALARKVGQLEHAVQGHDIQLQTLVNAIRKKEPFGFRPKKKAKK